MKQKYKDVRFTAASLALITTMNAVILEYQAQGLKLTVRQLYYQLVARDIIENTINSYKRIVKLLNDGRMDGLIDWDVIEDRTREIVTRSHWTSTGSIIQACANSYYMDRWANQGARVFVVVEKEALFGVLDGVCQHNDVPLLAARGFPSVTVLRRLALEFFMPALRAGQGIYLLHLGDHDPSGMFMTEDLENRLTDFLEGYDGDFHLNRIALNMAQIDKYNPPPNPAKETDSRFEKYAKEFGTESWELDALEPRMLIKLVQDNIDALKDEDAWAESGAEIEEGRAKLQAIANGLHNS